MLINKLGILYDTRREEAHLLAQELKGFLTEKRVWSASLCQEEEIAKNLPGTDLVFSLGGDGTLLRVAQVVLTHSIPILGVNIGKLGFITELTPQELKEKLPAILNGEGWIEERTMLQAVLEGKVYHCLNDIVLARGDKVRLIEIKVAIDGEKLTTYRADGLILSSATGSTAYNLAAGGPILYPHSRDFILKPIFAHLGFSAALILPHDSQVELVLISEQAILSIDGQVNIPVKGGQKVSVKSSPFTTRLLRLKPKGFYFPNLGVKLLRW